MGIFLLFFEFKFKLYKKHRALVLIVSTRAWGETRQSSQSSIQNFGHKSSVLHMLYVVFSSHHDKTAII